MRSEREAGLGHAGLGHHCERGGQSLKGFCVFWPCCKTCGILVPQPGIEPVLPALETCLNHW